ncbi:MAG: sodium:calcium antiporter [Xanthobacteraceae bacterium]|nr:sodium:calcium antiporter [Xanthobacteraceae bacterium]
MSLPDPAQHGLWVNVVVFVLAAAVVWAAGTRLARDLDGIAELTGMGRAFMGMLFLGGVTSLPEVAAVGTAAWTGNAALATNNLLGSVAINVMLLAVADAVLGRDALTSVVASPATLLQGTLNIILLTVLSAAVVVGDVEVLGMGGWTILLFVLCVAAFWLSSRYSQRAPWRLAASEKGRSPQSDAGAPKRPLSRLVMRAAGAAVVILVAGYALSRSGDALAQQTGLGAGLTGLVLVGFATSLPELSSITAAVRLRRYEMALGDVFGTNLLTIALLLLVDALYAGGPVLNEAGRFEAVAALLGAVLTGIFLVGLLERQNKTFLRMGYDAVAGLVVFAAGLALLATLQPS